MCKSKINQRLKQLYKSICVLVVLIASGCSNTLPSNKLPLLANTHANSDYFLISGYGSSDETGIYLVSYNKSSQTLTKEKFLAHAYNAAYLAWQPEQKTLYSIATTANKDPLLNQFLWNTQAQKFDLTQSYDVGGRGICHININNEHSQVATANYTSGDISLFTIGGGEINKIGEFQNSGKGLTSRQEAPHLHYVGWGNRKQFLYATDLGTDEILVFNGKNKSLTPIQRVKLQAGDGPRHLAFHPTLNVIYSLNELSNSISIFKQHEQTGNLSFIQKYSLNPQQNANVNNIASAIRIDKSGRHIYAAVRGENTLYALNIDEQGKLSLINKVNTGGDHPRDFNFSPQQNYIVVANQNSHQLNVIVRDLKSGALTASAAQLSMQSPSFVQAFEQ